VRRHPTLGIEMSKFDRRAALYLRNVVELAILLSGAQVR
jgi:hypothetical protein